MDMLTKVEKKKISIKQERARLLNYYDACQSYRYYRSRGKLQNHNYNQHQTTSMVNQLTKLITI